MKKSTVIIMWGLISSVLSALYVELLISIGKADGAWLFLKAIIFIAGLFLVMKQFRDKVNGGYASFGDLYKVGIFMSFVIAPVAVIHGFIMSTFRTEYLGSMLDMQRAQLIVHGFTEEQADRSMRMGEWQNYSAFGIILTGIVSSLLFALVIGLIPSGLLARTKPFMEEDNNTLQS